MESRPYVNRIPDQALLASDAVEGALHRVATRANDGSYGLIYLPSNSGPVEVNTALLSGQWLKVGWYDPRTGQVHGDDLVDRADTLTLVSPELDWVLVLDDSSARFPAPGKSF